MAEREERVFAVVARHTRVAHAPERNMVVHNVHNRVVDTSAARGSMVQDIVSIRSEVV